VLEYERLAAVRERFAARFARAIGLPQGVPKVLIDDQVTINEALSAEAAAMLARINDIIPETIDGERNPARSGTELRAFLGLAGNRFDLPEETRRRAYAQSREDVAFVASEFGITRYDYPEDQLKPGRFTTEISERFLDSVADRLVALNNQAMSTQMLLSVYQLRAAGKPEAAAQALRAAAARFPLDRRIERELTKREAKGE
jgi:hypothetical protein